MFRLGKLAASRPRVPHLSRYLGVNRPEIPESYDRSKIVPVWGVLGNDTVGDCTVAAVGHAIDLWTAAGGSPRLMTTDEAIACYEAFGYDPEDDQPNGSNPTDTGCDPQDVLAHWCASGFAAGGVDDRLTGFCSLTPTDESEHRFATYALGCVYLGLELPTAIEPAFSDNTIVWDLPDGQNLSGDWAPGSLGGHAVLEVGYDADHLVFISWGARYEMTWRFWRAYGVESYGLLDRDFAAPNVPAETWPRLEADMAALRATAA